MWHEGTQVYHQKKPQKSNIQIGSFSIFENRQGQRLVQECSYWLSSRAVSGAQDPPAMENFQGSTFQDLYYENNRPLNLFLNIKCTIICCQCFLITPYSSLEIIAITSLPNFTPQERIFPTYFWKRLCLKKLEMNQLESVFLTFLIRDCQPGRPCTVMGRNLVSDLPSDKCNLLNKYLTPSSSYRLEKTTLGFRGI